MGKINGLEMAQVMEALDLDAEGLVHSLFKQLNQLDRK